MSDYNEFHWTADGGVFPDLIGDLRWVSVPARSASSPANLWVRVTGLARFDFDPEWADDPDAWHRGQLGIVIPGGALSSGDVLTESAATGGFRVMKRDEEGPTDDFGIAIDGIASVSVSPAGFLNLALLVGFKGDCWLQAVSFALDLMIYRPSLDNFTPPAPPSNRFKYILQEALSEAFSKLLG